MMEQHFQNDERRIASCVARVHATMFSRDEMGEDSLSFWVRVARDADEMVSIADAQAQSVR